MLHQLETTVPQDPAWTPSPPFAHVDQQQQLHPRIHSLKKHGFSHLSNDSIVSRTTGRARGRAGGLRALRALRRAFDEITDLGWIDGDPPPESLLSINLRTMVPGPAGSWCREAKNGLLGEVQFGEGETDRKWPGDFSVCFRPLSPLTGSRRCSKSPAMFSLGKRISSRRDSTRTRGVFCG